MYYLYMELKELLYKIHKIIELQGEKDISQAKMAEEIGVSHRTYAEYLRGTNEPLAMKALLDMLNQIDDDVEMVRMVRMWKEEK